MKNCLKGLGFMLILHVAVALPLQKRNADRVLIVWDPNTEAWIITTPELIKDIIENEETPVQSLFRRTIPHFIAMSKFLKRDGFDFFEQSIDELKKLPNKSSALRGNITRINNFMRKYEDTRVTERNAIDIFDGFSKILIDFENMPANSELKMQLKTAFDASDYTTFTQKAEQKWNDFLKDFKGPLEAFVNELGAKERKQYADVVKLYDKLKEDESRTDTNGNNLFGYLFNAY